MTDPMLQQVHVEDRLGNVVTFWTESPVFHGIKQSGSYFYVPGNKNIVIAPFELKTFYTKFYSDCDLFPVPNWVHKDIKISALPVKKNNLIKCQLQNTSNEPVQLASGTCFIAFFIDGGTVWTDCEDSVLSEWSDVWTDFRKAYPTVFDIKNKPASCPVFGLEYWRPTFDAIPLKPRPIPINVYPKVEKARIDKFLEAEVEAGQMERVALDELKFLTPANFKIKPNGQIRPVFDFRMLNSFFLQTSKAPVGHATPDVMGCVKDLPQFKFALSVDLKSAYHNLKMPDWVTPFFGISHNGFFYKLLSLPEGFCLSPQLFHWTLKEVIDRQYCGYSVSRYFDDILMTGETISELKSVFQILLKQCSEFGFRISEQKCVFGEGSVKWLGYNIHGNGDVTPGLEMKAIEDIIMKPDGFCLKDMQRLVGLMNRWKLQAKDVEGFFHITKQYMKGSLTQTDLQNKWEALKQHLFFRSRFVSFDAFELAVDWFGADSEQCGVIFCGLKGEEKHLLFYTCFPIDGFHSSLLGELISLHQSLKLILKGNWLTRQKHIAILSDSKTLIDLLNRGSLAKMTDLRIRRRISDIFEWGQDMQWSLSFTHIDSVANCIADFLSRKVCNKR